MGALRKERPYHRNNNQAYNKAYQHQTGSAFHIVHKFVAAGAEYQSTGRSANGSCECAGCSNSNRHYHSLGVCIQLFSTKEQVREAFGELRYMGADYCYKYDKETRKKTEEVEALKLHLGSMKLGNSVDIRLEATELPKVEPYTVVELEEAVYAPYVQRGNFPVLVDRISCKGIRVVTGKGNV